MDAEALALVGPNGAGKSILLAVLAAGACGWETSGDWTTSGSGAEPR